MDWSLLDPHAKHRFLRQTLAYKSTWPYYMAMVIDPIIRFNWVLYAIFAHNTQHSTLVSFFVSFSEVCRRGMWVIFRVENEHCTNVGRFRASRDVPLPYDVTTSSSSTLASKSPQTLNGQQGDTEVDTSQSPRYNRQGELEPPKVRLKRAATAVSGADIGRTSSHTTTETPSLRRRQTANVVESPMTRAMNRVGTLLHTAHAQDFERKKKPELGKPLSDEEDDDDDEGENSEHEEATRAAIEEGRVRSSPNRAADNADADDEGAVSLSPPDPRSPWRDAGQDNADRDDLKRVRSALDAAREDSA